MSKRTSPHLPLPRSALRGAAMNTALVMLLAGVFLWSAAGNAIDAIRVGIERRV